MFDFQPKGKSWNERAKLTGLNSVLDPNDISNKNFFIDTIHKKAIKQFINRYSNGKFNKCLDFGCGIGRLADFLSQFSNTYIGIDVTDEMISKARKNNKETNRNFLVYNGLNIPEENNSVDFICSVLVLQHINNQEEFDYLSIEIGRVLKKRGILLFIEQTTKEKNEKYYIDAFVKNGFKLVKIKNIRYGRSISSWLISRIKNDNKLADFFVKVCCFINQIEILFNPIILETYKETIFCLERK